MHLALKGSQVIMACRNVDKCKAAANEITLRAVDEGINDIQLVTMKVDLGSLESTKIFADEVKKNFDRLVNFQKNVASIFEIPMNNIN